MKTIRLAGRIKGAEDPNREIRAQTLYKLFAAGWNIQNSNGDEDITLSNIEEKIIAANAFMFMPDPTLQDIFKAISIFVGYQTLDHHLANKPTVILDTNDSWQALFSLLDSLKSLGTIQQNYEKYLLVVHSTEAALEYLQSTQDHGIPSVGRQKIKASTTQSFNLGRPDNIQKNICVFCSASIQDKNYLDEGYTLGKLLAKSAIGCVSGAGTTGVMGSVVRGCVESGGWAAGSNVPHIIELEGLPDGLSEFWLRDDIYTRMEVMIEKSDGFIIFPGGSGTLQEVLALLIFKNMGHPLMLNKPIVIYNKAIKHASESGFWDKLMPMLAMFMHENHFIVVDSIEAAIKQASSREAN